MSPIVLRTPDAELAGMSKEELVKAFSDCFRITVEALVRAARIIGQWHENGWDISELQAVAGKWLHRLRLINSGQLLPELAFKLDGQPALLNMFARLHVDDQKKIVDDEPIPVATFTADNQPDTLMVPPSRLMDPRAAFHRKQVFDKDHIRNLAEQRLWLDAEKKQKRKVKPDKVNKFNLDRERGGAVHRGEFISLAELVEVVKALRKS